MSFKLWFWRYKGKTEFSDFHSHSTKDLEQLTFVLLIQLYATNCKCQSNGMISWRDFDIATKKFTMSLRNENKSVVFIPILNHFWNFIDDIHVQIGTSLFQSHMAIIVICFLFLQAIKQKLHMKSRVGEETPLTDVQQEEDKMKMLLGAKVLVSGVARTMMCVKSSKGQQGRWFFHLVLALFILNAHAFMESIMSTKTIKTKLLLF